MKKLLSLLLPLAMFACMLPAFVLPAAAEEPKQDDGSIRVVSGEDNARYTGGTYEGDVAVGDNTTAVLVSGEKIEYKINGSVEAGESCTGIWADNGGKVTVSGDVTVGGIESGNNAYGVYADNGGTVEVTGSVAAGTQEGEMFGTGIYAYDGGKVTVGGSVEAGKYGKGIWADNGYVRVEGNVSAPASKTELMNSRGIDIRADGIVSVSGDVSGEIGAEFNNLDSESTLIVEGTLSGESCDIFIASVYGAVPEIVVGQLGDELGDVMLGVATGSNFGTEAVYNKIRYIINADGMTVDGADKYENVLTGTVYDVAHEADELTFSAAAKNGYRLVSVDFGSYADEVINKGNGIYTVTVLRGGGLNFKASFEKIAAASASAEPCVPQIHVIFDEEMPEISSAGSVVKATVVCGDMRYAEKQFASAIYMLDGKAEDAEHFTVTLSADGRLEISLAEELLAELEPGVHTVEMHLANGKIICFKITAMG